MAGKRKGRLHRDGPSVYILQIIFGDPCGECELVLPRTREHFLVKQKVQLLWSYFLLPWAAFSSPELSPHSLLCFFQAVIGIAPHHNTVGGIKTNTILPHCCRYSVCDFTDDRGHNCSPFVKFNYCNYTTFAVNCKYYFRLEI